MASVRLQGIGKQFDGAPVIQGIDLDIADGEFVVLVGPTGCGKSTLLRILAGLEDADAGSVEIGGRVCNDVAAARRGIALVSQDQAPPPARPVAGKLGFFQASHAPEHQPGALSGGQRQRAAIERAIASQPQVFLFDEPLSNLDPALRGQTRLELARLHRELGATMVYVTHDQVEAMTLGQRIVVLNGGRIEQAGTPQALYERPVNQFVAGFLGSPRMNFLPGALAGEEGSAAHVRLPGGAVLRVAADVTRAAPGAGVTIGVRPEHLRVQAGGSLEGGIVATVVMVEFLGDATIAHVQPDHMAGLIAVKCHAGVPAPEQDDRVLLVFEPAQAHLFDAAGAAFPRHQTGVYGNAKDLL